MRLAQLSGDSLVFPPLESALREPNGLLAMGGDLSLLRLLAAYQQGIFPWYTSGQPILWWSPDPRAVLFPDQFHLSRSMKQFHRKSHYRVTLNYAFERTIQYCAHERAEGTWITAEIIAAYLRLHEAGAAHSIEVWEADELVGGLYGVAQGALFCGESMFSRRPNASKTALMIFCQHFLHHGGKLLDCQILNSHTASLGAITIPRQDYLRHLAILQSQTLAVSCWHKQVLSAA